MNQVLPGGVAGDAVRGLRHHRGVRDGAALERPGTRVVLALVVDRFSGQLALWAVVAATAPAFWRALPLAPATRALVIGLPLAAVAAGLAWALARRFRGRAASLWEHGGRAAFASPSALVHLAISLALVGLHALVFWAAARSLAVALDLSVLVRVVPLLLVVSSLPAFFAGWGVREATAAALFQLSGLSPSDGASVSVVFGLASLLGSLPGLLAIRARRAARD